MKMNKQDYKNVLIKLNPSVLDTLRQVAGWVDVTLIKNHSRNLVFRELEMSEESGLGTAIGVEAMNGIEFEGMAQVRNLLSTDWQIFSNNNNGTLTLNYEEYSLFRSALRELLKKQPFGYEKTLLDIPKIKEVKVENREGKVYLVFGNDKPIYMADITEMQGKLLRLLGDPMGAARSLEGVAEALGPNADEGTVRNTVRELRRKLVDKGKRNSLGFSFNKKTLRMRIN